jgi:hypothetical protein
MTNTDIIAGRRGCRQVATSTAAATLSASAIVIREDLVVTSIKEDGFEVLTEMGLSGITLSAGELLTPSRNAFTEIKTASAGSIMEYKA